MKPSPFGPLIVIALLSQCLLVACHEQASSPELAKPDVKPQTVIQAASAEESDAAKLPVASNTPVKTLDWIDLLPVTTDREALMEHYADLVIQRLDPETDRELQKKIIAEFNQAPPNLQLNATKVRLAGYMLVLDDREGQIQEFILVPYSGAGVHQPAPPANQMILVRPKSGQALASSEQYQAVWIEGQLTVTDTETTVARVAYLLEDAQVHLYTADDAKQAEATQNQPEHDEHAHGAD